MCRSAYIHIPFCKSKCKYCSFISGTDLTCRDEYVTVLLEEIKHFYNGEKLKTIYLGGGTPSLLPADKIADILKLLNFDETTEVTFEINPDDTSENYLMELKKCGINRLSFGSQTFDNNILKLIGRRHNSESIINSVLSAESVGFENISLDLIYGLPEQTEEKLLKDLEIIKFLDVKHVSTYGLKIEEPSYFSICPPKNLPDSDAQADMYILINNFLENIGYKRYEISNFSKDGFESRHNLNYWNNAEYYGFGLAAHGYKDGVRYSNTTSLNSYLKTPCEHEAEHKVTEKEKIEEEIFLGFRRERGIDSEDFYNKFGFGFEEHYQNIIKKYSPEYIERTESGFKLTLRGVLLSNIILADFMGG